MICENKFCNKNIVHGNLVCLDLNGQDIRTGIVKKIKMLVAVCDGCIAKYNYQSHVRGEINVPS